MAADMAMTVLASWPLAEALASDGGPAEADSREMLREVEVCLTDAINPLGGRFDRALESRTTSLAVCHFWGLQSRCSTRGAAARRWASMVRSPLRLSCWIGRSSFGAL